MNPSRKAWEVWNVNFKDGDEIIVEDWDGDFYFGKLKTLEWGIRIKRSGGIKKVEIAWEDIVFIAHAGFPVQKIMGMDGKEAEKLSKKTPDDIIRAKLIELSKNKKPPREPKKGVLDKVVDLVNEWDKPIYNTFGGGCPFVFEKVQVIDLIFPGNNGWDFWGADDEETLILGSEDGATMLSYDLSHLFFFDGLEKEMNIQLVEGISL